MTFPLANLEGRRFGANFNAEELPYWDYAREQLLAWQSRFNVVMNGPRRAIEVAELLPNSIVDGRKHSTLETEYWMKRSPAEAVAELEAWGAVPHERVGWSIANEQRTAGYNEQWLKWEMETGRRMADKRMHYFLAIAVGKTLFRGGIESGQWDPFIKEINENPYLHLGIHEYGYIFPMAQWMPNYPYNMFDGAAMHPDNWPDDIPHGRNADGTMPHNWHIGRIEWLQIRAEELGYPRIPYVISEAMHDNMDDVSRYPYDGLTNGQSLKEWAKSNFNGGEDVDGINSLRGIYNHVLPNIPFESLFYKQLQWADKVYAPECIGIALFTWSTNKKWRRFAIQDLRATHTLMRNLPIRNGIHMTDAPDTKPVEPDFPDLPADNDTGWGDPVTIGPKFKSFNIRSEPSTRLDDKSVILNIVTPHVMWQHESAGEDVDDPEWSWVALKMMDGTKGWAALGVLDVQPIEEEPEPPVEPEPTPEPEPEPTPVPPTDPINYYPIEICMNVPVNYMTDEQKEELARKWELEAYMLLGAVYALRGKKYSPTIIDMPGVVPANKAQAMAEAQANKHSTQTTPAVKVEKAS